VWRHPSGLFFIFESGMKRKNMSWAPIERVKSFVRTRRIETETEVEESNIRKEVKLLVRKLVGEATSTIQLQNHPYWDGVRMSSEGDLYLLRARSSCKALIENADKCPLAIKIKLRSRKT